MKKKTKNKKETQCPSYDPQMGYRRRKANDNRIHKTDNKTSERVLRKAGNITNGKRNA